MCVSVYVCVCVRVRVSACACACVHVCACYFGISAHEEDNIQLVGFLFEHHHTFCLLCQIEHCPVRQFHKHEKKLVNVEISQLLLLSGATEKKLVSILTINFCTCF